MVVITTAGAATGTSPVTLTLFGVILGAVQSAASFTLQTSTDIVVTRPTVTSPAVVAAAPVAISAAIESSADLPSVCGRLTDGRKLVFVAAAAADSVPNTVSTGAVTVSFTMVNTVQVGASRQRRAHPAT